MHPHAIARCAREGAGAFHALAALVCASLLHAESVEVSPIPLVPGTWWEYRESYTERVGGLGSTSDDMTRFEVRGSATRPFLSQSGGFDPASGPIEVGESWLRIGPWTGEEALPLPLQVGRQGPAAEGGPERWTVATEESVTVPAGTFSALRCDFLTRRNASTLWIAPGVGIVRETYGEPGVHPDLERVLVRWGLGRGKPSGEREPRAVVDLLRAEWSVAGDLTFRLDPLAHSSVDHGTQKP